MLGFQYTQVTRSLDQTMYKTEDISGWEYRRKKKGNYIMKHEKKHLATEDEPSSEQ